jgi:hypothetical protein
MTFREYMDRVYNEKELYHSQIYPYSFSQELKYKGLDLVIRGEFSFIFDYYMARRSEIVSKLDIIDFHIDDILSFLIYKSFKNKNGNTEEHCFYNYKHDRGLKEVVEDRLFNIGLHENDANFLKHKLASIFIKEMMKRKDDTLSPIRDYVDEELEHRKDEMKSDWAFEHSPGDIRI